jgi:hypothetical protein
MNFLSIQIEPVPHRNLLDRERVSRAEANRVGGARQEEGVEEEAQAPEDDGERRRINQFNTRKKLT